MAVFSEEAWCGPDVLFKVITEGRGVLKAAGQRDLRDRIRGGTQHLRCDTKAVP